MFIVVCNSKIQSAKIRVKVILHELGHYLLHRAYVESGVAVLKQDSFDNPFEKEANLFALIGMVPDKLVDGVCDRFDRFEERVEYLQHEYEFSREEAVWRIVAFDPDLRRSSYRQMYERFLGGYPE
jgi:Zn-dependent peptidase ImmA (M78 family)